MAKNSMKILSEAHIEDVRMVSATERGLKQSAEHLGQRLAADMRHQLQCRLKSTTKLFWGNENCHLT